MLKNTALLNEEVILHLKWKHNSFIFLSPAFSFESGTGNSSSFSYVDVYNNLDYRCSQGSLQNEVLLLRELETGITENTTGTLRK